MQVCVPAHIAGTLDIADHEWSRLQGADDGSVLFRPRDAPMQRLQIVRIATLTRRSLEADAIAHRVLTQ
jgi:hypothetical protein